jgi:excisionase family DNA binding protein
MNHSNDLILDRLLDLLAEKLTNRLSQESTQVCPRLLTIEQAAVYLGLTPEATRSLTTPGKLSTIRLEHGVFIDRLDLDDWIEDNKVGWAKTAGRGREKEAIWIEIQRTR